MITIPQTLVLPKVDTIFSDQIMCFINEMGYYMDSLQRDQGRKLTGKVPTVAEFWEGRLGTSAVTCMLALYEYDRLHLNVSLFCYLVADRSYRQIRRWIGRQNPAVHHDQSQDGRPRARGQLEPVPVSCIGHRSPTTSRNLDETSSDRLADDKRSNDIFSLQKEIVSQIELACARSPF